MQATDRTSHWERGPASRFCQIVRPGFPAAAAVAAVALLVSGCSSAASSNAVVLQKTIAPIVLKAAREGLVFIAEDSGDPVVSGIALLGVWGIDNIEPAVASASTADPNDTLLIVRQTIHGKVKESLFRISTDRELQVTMNGKFVEDITQREITITVAPDTRSTIEITDANADEQTYRSAIVHLRGTIDGVSAVNLDTGQLHPSPSQEEIDTGMGGNVDALNGTTVAIWSQPVQPSLAGCSSIPKREWGTVLSSVRMWRGIPSGTTWCVHTPAGRYGAIIWQQRSMIVEGFSYVLWKRPGDK